MDAKTLVNINSVIQVLLLFALGYAAYLARKKRLNRHCLVMRIAVAVQIVVTLAIMLQSLLGYQGVPDSFFGAEIIVHHSLGVVTILIWIFANLVQMGVIKFPYRLRPFMRTAAVTWVVTFALGVHMYFVLWT